jgi:hypothetical protein
MSAPIDWKFTLEKSAAGGVSQKDILKDPLGFKQDLTDVNVRAAQKSNVTQVEVLESVSLFQNKT